MLSVCTPPPSSPFPSISTITYIPEFLVIPARFYPPTPVCRISVCRNLYFTSNFFLIYRVFPAGYIHIARFSRVFSISFHLPVTLHDPINFCGRLLPYRGSSSFIKSKKKIKQEEKMEREYTTDEKVYRYLSIREKYLNWGKFVSI